MMGFQLFSDVLLMFLMFSDVSDVLRVLKIAHRCSTDILGWVQDVFRCFQMFTNVLGRSFDVL